MWYELLTITSFFDIIYSDKRGKKMKGIELRNKFSTDLLGRCEKDGTYPESISLNGVFVIFMVGVMVWSSSLLHSSITSLLS